MEVATPVGNGEAVVMISPVLMVIVKVCCTDKWVGLVLSVTVTVTGVLADTVGDPVMAPVEAFSVSPAGRPGALQVYCGVPPVAFSCAV